MRKLWSDSSYVHWLATPGCGLDAQTPLEAMATCGCRYRYACGCGCDCFCELYQNHGVTLEPALTAAVPIQYITDDSRVCGWGVYPLVVAIYMAAHKLIVMAVCQA